MMVLHTIELTQDGYKLVIWQPMPPSLEKPLPYTFKATYFISSPLEVPEILSMVQGRNENSYTRQPTELLISWQEQRSLPGLDQPITEPRISY
jgi:hypothetical protein